MAINTIPYVGSKQRSVAEVLPKLGTGDLLVSPFVGMAAIEMAALEAGAFKRAVLGDSSPYVMAVLRACKADPAKLRREHVRVANYIGGDPSRLKVIQEETRTALDSGCGDMVVAAALLGAKAWSYSGLWVRCNSSGGLNASCDPRGRGPVALKTLERYARLLERCNLVEATWGRVLAACPDGSTVYIDPPYLGKGGFTSYTAEGWREPDAQLLAECVAKELQGCRVVLSEQSPGGGPLYAEVIGKSRPTTMSARSMVRNCRGDQMAQVRLEVVLVAEAVA